MFRLLTLCFVLIISIFSFSQNVKNGADDNIEHYKSQFFLYPTIGVDSALIYIDKVFLSDKAIDLAFAHAAKRHLLIISGEKVNYEEIQILIENNVKEIDNKDLFNKDLSNIYNISGNSLLYQFNYNDALVQFKLAEGYALKDNNEAQVVKVRSNITLIQGELGLYDEAIKGLKSSIFFLETNKHKFIRDYFEVLEFNFNLNLAKMYINKYDLDTNTVYADSSMLVLNKINRNKNSDWQKAEVFLNLGIVNTLKGDYGNSESFLFKSLNIFSEISDSSRVSNVYFNRGINFYDSGRFIESKASFKEVLKYDKFIDTYNKDKLSSYEYLSKIYSEEKQIDSAHYYAEQFIENYNLSSEKERKDYKQAYKSRFDSELNLEKEKFNNKIDTYKYGNTLLIFLIISIILGFTSFYIFNRNKSRRKIEDLLSSKNAEENNTIQNFKISSDLELEIIEKLKKFEKEKLYLNSNFSTSFLAKKLNTNTTYLFKVLRKYRNYDSFSDYVNSLRVNYITNELKNNKQIRNYTLQAIAEIVGYKNGTSFARIFKSKTGVSLTKYIKYINKSA